MGGACTKTKKKKADFGSQFPELNSNASQSTIRIPVQNIGRNVAMIFCDPESPKNEASASHGRGLFDFFEGYSSPVSCKFTIAEGRAKNTSEQSTKARRPKANTYLATNLEQIEKKRVIRSKIKCKTK